MKRYGTLNDLDEGDVLANQLNAAPTHWQSCTGKRGNRSTKKQKRIRTQMNKRTRAVLKRLLLKEDE